MLLLDMFSRVGLGLKLLPEVRTGLPKVCVCGCMHMCMNTPDVSAFEIWNTNMLTKTHYTTYLLDLSYLYPHRCHPICPRSAASRRGMRSIWCAGRATWPDTIHAVYGHATLGSRCCDVDMFVRVHKSKFIHTCHMLVVSYDHKGETHIHMKTHIIHISDIMHINLPWTCHCTSTQSTGCPKSHG